MLHDNGGERLVSVDVSDRFYRSLDLPSEQVEEIAVEGFALPWTGLRWKQGRPYLEAFRSVLQRYYSPNLLDVFNEAAERFAIAPA